MLQQAVCLTPVILYKVSVNIGHLYRYMSDIAHQS